MCHVGDLGSEPTVDAFRVEYVAAYGDLTHGISLLELLKAYHAVGLLEVIYLLVIWLFLDETD